MEAAAPPLTYWCAAHCAGPPLPRQGCCAPLRGRLRRALTPETSAAPGAGTRGQAPSLPPPDARPTTPPG